MNVFCQVLGEYFKLSSIRTSLPIEKKDTFGHVTSLIGRNVTAAY